MMKSFNKQRQTDMEAFMHSGDLIKAEQLRGPSDLYRALLTVKNGFGNGKTKLGCYCFTKAQIKSAGIDWMFVVNSSELLGLKLENKHGRRGHIVSN